VTPVQEQLCQPWIVLLLLYLTHHIIQDDKQVELGRVALLLVQLFNLLVQVCLRFLLYLL
jgi:hypothetical protein